MEKWLPTVHEVLHVVELSRADHRVQTKRGQTYGIGLLTLRYKLTEGRDAWQITAFSLSAGAKGPVIMRDDLADFPAWLLAIVAQATRINPEIAQVTAPPT